MQIPTPLNFTTVATALALALALPAQQENEPTPKPKPARVEKLDAWPELSDTDRDRLLGYLVQFRKDKEELRQSAREQLIRIGAAGAPLLFQKVNDRPDNINADLFPVLDEVLKPEHAALLAREIKKPHVALRRYLTQRLSRFFDPDMKPVLVATMKDKDEATAFYAALGALALREQRALPAVLAYSKARWHEVGPITAEVLSKARSNETGSWVFEAIAKAPPADRMAGLRLARYLAVKDHNVILRGYLETPDHAVKKAAINALRVIHGQPPIENLSVFQAIGMAKEWLAKI